MLLGQTVQVGASLGVAIGTSSILLLLDIRQILTERSYILVGLVDEIIFIESVCVRSLLVAIALQVPLSCNALLVLSVASACSGLEVGLKAVALGAVVALQVLYLLLG